MGSPETFNDLDLINQALTRMGEGHISNLEEDTETRAVVMRDNYSQIREDCMTKRSWRFLTAQAALNKLTDEPENRWSAAWQMPADNLRLLYVWPPETYELKGKRIYTDNTSAVEIEYLRYLDEAEWPAWFREYVVTTLIVKTVKGITGKDPSVEQRQDAMTALVDASTNDSQQQPNQQSLPNPFVDCRH